MLLSIWHDLQLLISFFMDWPCFPEYSVEIVVHGYVINKGCFDIFAVCFVGVCFIAKVSPDVGWRFRFARGTALS